MASPISGGPGYGRGCQPCEPTDDREGDDEREPNSDEEDYSGTEDDTVGCGGYVGPSKVVLAIPGGADIAKSMLREHAKRIPTGEVVREINPTVVPQIDPKKF
jgi:hypothetical protein